MISRKHIAILCLAMASASSVFVNRSPSASSSGESVAVFASTPQTVIPESAASRPSMAPWGPFHPSTEGEFEQNATLFMHERADRRQLLEVEWTAIEGWGGLPEYPEFLYAKRSYGARYKILTAEPHDRWHNIVVAGVDEKSGATIVENWEFSAPKAVFSSSDKRPHYEPGSPHNISVVYSGNAVGRRGIRAVASYLSAGDQVKVLAQYHDSGDVYLSNPDGSDSIKVFGALGSGAQHSFSPAHAETKFLMTGTVQREEDGASVVLLAISPLRHLEPQVGIRLMDSDTDGHFEEMRTYSSSEWANLNLLDF